MTVYFLCQGDEYNGSAVSGAADLSPLTTLISGATSDCCGCHQECTQLTLTGTEVN